MLKHTTKTATIDTFLTNKKFYPFRQWRTMGKTFNLSLLFGAQASTFAKALKAGGFTESDADDTLDTFNLNAAYNKMCIEKADKMKPLDCKYLICATMFREMFFKTYPGLMVRLERERAFAKRNGYTQTWHGAVRHLPELKYVKFNSKGNLIGADKKLFGSMISNILNITGNSPIQTLEAYHAFTLWHCAQYNLKKWGFKSRIYNGTHDSLDVFLWKPETDIVLALFHKICSIPKVPYADLPLQLDGEIADMSTPDLLNDNYYKGGAEFNLKKKYDGKLEGLLEEYNKKNGTNLIFEDVVPK